MTSQILRHTAVVLAGMASIGFTVAAGTYVVNQMGTDHPHEAVGSPAPQPENVVPNPIPAPLLRLAEPSTPQPSTAAVRFTAETRALPVVPGSRALPITLDLRTPTPLTPAAPRPSTAATASVQTGIAPAPTDTAPVPRLNLPGDTYIGANLTGTPADSLSMTLDTNLLTPRPDTSTAATRFRTDVDVRHGRLTLALTNPLADNNSGVEPQSTPAPAQSTPLTPA